MPFRPIFRPKMPHWTTGSHSAEWIPEHGDNAQSSRYRCGLRRSRWSECPHPMPAYHSFRKTARLQGGLSVDPSCQPTSVNEDGWHCRSMDGRDGRKLPDGGSFISQSGSIISRWTCAKGCGWAQPATLQPAGFANKNLEPKQFMCVRLLSNFLCNSI